MKNLLRWFVLPVAFSASSALAATYTVSNLKDSGTGSLRSAIQSANAAPGSKITFSISGTISLVSPLPDIGAKTSINGATAPGFSGTPTVVVQFNGNPGFIVAKGADESTISSLSLVGAGNAGVTLRGSKVTVAGNYIGLLPNGTVSGNFGDGIRILAASDDNIIGHVNPVTGVDYYNTTDNEPFTIPVTGWQGIRNSGTTEGEFLICGTSGSNGLLYNGPIDGGGDSYDVIYPGSTTISTSVYGPDNLKNGKIRLVGAYRKTGTTETNFGFAWEGTLNQLPSGGKFTTIAYPGATLQFVHSTMGNLAVGNCNGPALEGNIPLDAGKAFIYDLASKTFITNIIYPKSKTTTAYGIWQNGPTNYTICGGYSPRITNNLKNPETPLTEGKGFLVDYNSKTKTFSNWTSFEYPNGTSGVSFATHFEGISSQEPGVYTLSADSVQDITTSSVQGSWVSVRRNSDGTFDKGVWVDLNYPGYTGLTNDSVYGHYVVGIVVSGTAPTFAFQAQINDDFQLSNVISGNHANGIAIMGSNRNVISMNNIGTNPAGTAAGFGNEANGILVTNGASSNLIGGQAAGINNPTGSKNPANAVFQRPPQGNLISGNTGHGVLINGNSVDNVLSGNYIGTDAQGLSALANGGDGVVIDKANRNSLLGCTLYQNPFVFYNVIAGNIGHGVRVKSSNNVTIQANFLGMGSDNATSVPNGGNGLIVEGSSRNTQVGGVIPLGNVIAGNTRNGIEVTDSVSGFISFNTFGGIAAFQTFPSPNGENGILITSNGGNNTIRTCIISGNLGNGIELSGKATGVQITDTSVGTNTDISAAIPNQGNGIVIRGKAHNNAIGGFQPSVEPECFISGNKKYGIVISEGAFNNYIFHTSVGVGAPIFGDIPNEQGGILLDRGSRGTTIGGKKEPFQNTISANTTAGLYINISKQNTVLNNSITDNGEVGIYGFGPCTGTLIKDNTVTGNGSGGKNNVDLSKSTGIRFVP